jgi:hypothetical protein
VKCKEVQPEDCVSQKQKEKKNKVCSHSNYYYTEIDCVTVAKLKAGDVNVPSDCFHPSLSNTSLASHNSAWTHHGSVDTPSCSSVDTSLLSNRTGPPTSAHPSHDTSDIPSCNTSDVPSVERSVFTCIYIELFSACRLFSVATIAHRSTGYGPITLGLLKASSVLAQKTSLESEVLPSVGSRVLVTLR